MVQIDMLRQKFDSLNSEQLLLGFLILVSGYMVAQTFQWNRVTAIFPRYIGLATLIGSALLLFRDYLPEPLHTVVTGDTSITGGRQETDEVKEKKSEEQLRRRRTSLIGRSHLPSSPQCSSRYTSV